MDKGLNKIIIRILWEVMEYNRAMRDLMFRTVTVLVRSVYCGCKICLDVWMDC